MKRCNAHFLEVQSFAGAGTEAFCSGGDQRVRGVGGYVGTDTVPRLNVLDLQVGSLRSDVSELLMDSPQVSAHLYGLITCLALGM